ncbi:hypothetical protein MRX96_020908 [Rhipicephalus microplus]
MWADTRRALAQAAGPARKEHAEFMLLVSDLLPGRSFSNAEAKAAPDVSSGARPSTTTEGGRPRRRNAASTRATSEPPYDDVNSREGRRTSGNSAPAFTRS